MSKFEPEIYLAYVVDISSLDINARDNFTDLLSGKNNPLSPLPEEQDYGILKEIWDNAIDEQYSTHKLLKEIFTLQIEENFPLGTLIFHTVGEDLYKPYPNNQGLSGFEIPLPMGLIERLNPDTEQLFIHSVSLNERYIPEEADFYDLAAATDSFAKRFRKQSDYYENIGDKRIWFTGIMANQVEQALVYIRQEFKYLPKLS